MPTIKDASRGNYSTQTDAPTWQEVRDGALLRIADATEKMAQRHTELMRERDYYEQLANSRAEHIRRLERSNAALRGVIARMKRAQVAPNEE